MAALAPRDRWSRAFAESIKNFVSRSCANDRPMPPERREDVMKTQDTATNMTATVLIVDDDPGTRLLIGSALEIVGFRVTTAPDGASALTEFRARPVDCVILDVVMPGM